MFNSVWFEVIGDERVLGSIDDWRSEAVGMRASKHKSTGIPSRFSAKYSLVANFSSFVLGEGAIEM